MFYFSRYILTTTCLIYPYGAFTGMDPYNKMTCNEILQIYGKTLLIYGAGNPFTTGFLNLITHQDLYLTSASLGSFDAMGARGESSVI